MFFSILKIAEKKSEAYLVIHKDYMKFKFQGLRIKFYLGALNPIGTIFSSYFIQHITSGGSYLDKSMYPSQIADLITSIIIYLCGFVLFFKLTLTKSMVNRRDKKK